MAGEDSTLTGAAGLGDTLDRLGDLRIAADQFTTTLNGGLRSAVVQGKALDDVLRQIALRLSAKVLETALAPLTSALGTLASGLTGGLSGLLSGLLSGVLPFAKGGVVPFADGGVVARPTYFPLAGGLGVAGEAGSEAILPLTRDATGRLGVRSQGGGGLAVTFNVTTPDSDSFRRSEAQLTAMLARAVGRGRRGL